MKRSLLFSLFIATLISMPSFAGNLDLGSQTVQFQADLDFDGPYGSDFLAEAGYGRFIKKNQEVGGIVNLENNNILTSILIGGYGRLYFPQTPLFAPYVGGGLALGHTSVNFHSSDESKTALILTLNGGGLYFISNQLAIDGKLNLNIGTSDIYVGKNDTKATDLRLMFGLKYFWGSAHVTQAEQPRTSTAVSEKKSATPVKSSATTKSPQKTQPKYHR